MKFGSRARGDAPVARICAPAHSFGSRARGDAAPGSDLDLAVRGMPPERFFRAVGETCSALSIPVDIVDLDESSPALDYLKEHGDFLRVA